MAVNNNNVQDIEWVSVSELADRLGTTKQTIYNHIKQGYYPTKEFKRGKMRGLLCGVPKTIMGENE